MGTLDSDMFIDERNWDWLDVMWEEAANAEVVAQVMFMHTDD